jgi:hypothetical protein
MLSAALLSAKETGIDGKWTIEMQMNSPDGRSYTNKSTFVLKTEDGALTGTVESNGRTVAISDGKVEGNKFTFVVKFEGNKGIRTLTYDGVLEQDHLKGNLKVRGIGQVWPFEATRAD